MDELKYPKERYEEEIHSFYGGDMDSDIEVISAKLVKCRRVHKCMGGCERIIGIGQYAVCEKSFFENGPVSCYTCTDCLDRWIDEMEG